MAGLLDSSLPGHPIKAVVTLSAPFDFTVIQSMLRQRVADCGYSPSCPQDKQDPPQDTLAAFATMYDFLGCPTGNCSSQLLRAASPVTHVTASAPPFLIFNSSDELIPGSQATDMAAALKAARVPEQVVIVPGSQHGEAYLPQVDGTILNYLGDRLGLSGLGHATNTAPGGSSGTLTILVVLCLVVVAGSVVVIAFVMRRRRAAVYRRPVEYRRPTGTRYR
jgi:acetyl esterase/lipase